MDGIRQPIPQNDLLVSAPNAASSVIIDLRQGEIR